MEQKNGVQQTLLKGGVLFKIEEHQQGLPEIISEETFMELLEMQLDSDDSMPTNINDEEFENDDLEDDGLNFV